MDEHDRRAARPTPLAIDRPFATGWRFGLGFVLAAWAVSFVAGFVYLIFVGIVIALTGGTLGG